MKMIAHVLSLKGSWTGARFTLSVLLFTILVAPCSSAQSVSSFTTREPPLASASHTPEHTPDSEQTPTLRPAERIQTVPTPEDIEATVQTFARALQAQNAAELSSVLVEDQIWLAEGPNGDTGVAITRKAALDWLNSHWGANRRVISHEYTNHFVLLEITTGDWAALAPIEAGNLVFHLHRYNAQGQADPIHGSWRVDAILYQ
jgi:hypothetical protein